MNEEMSTIFLMPRRFKGYVEQVRYCLKRKHNSFTTAGFNSPSVI